MLNAPNNQYNPLTPVQQQQLQSFTAQPQQVQGQQQAPQDGIYSMPTYSYYMPPATDFNGVKLIINNPQGLSTGGTVPANYFIPQNVPVVPAGVPAAQPTQQPTQQPNTQPAQTPEPVVKTEPVTNEPEVTEPTNEMPGLQVQSFTAGLNSDNIEEQENAMQGIINAVHGNEKEAAALHGNEKIYEALINIAEKDSSNLPGLSEEMAAKREELMTNAQTKEEQDDAYMSTRSEQEAFADHQSNAIYTIAELQDAYLLDKEQKGEEPEINSVPALSNIVEIVKSNPEPKLREAAIGALTSIARPYYKPELSQIFTLAAEDADENVRQTANNALEQLAEI